jgi:Arrestin (or S-antigen), N-terminal domain
VGLRRMFVGGSPAATADVALRVVPGVCRPGDTVTVHVTATPTADAEDAELAVVLRHVQRWNEGEGPDRVEDWEVAGEYLFRGTLRAGETVSGTVALPVPRRITPPEGPQDCRDERYRSSEDTDDGDTDGDDDPYDVWIDDEERWGTPTSEGPRAVTAWRVEAGLVAGVDEVGKADAALVVLAPPGPAPTDAPQRRGGKDVRARFTGLPTGSLPAPATVSGRLWLTAEREVAARRVRVELVRQVGAARDGEEPGKVFHDEVVAAADPATGVTLPAGQPREFAFALALPDLAPPSVESSRFGVRWLLRATVDRPWRADDVWEQALAVHGAEY